MSDRVSVSTIGFTQTSAEDFFQRLLNAGVKKVVDVRLHNTSQLSGFAKAGDLAYFLRTIGGMEYAHDPLLAPTDDILKAYKKEKGDWSLYERRFMELMKERKIESKIIPESLCGACLLCSEPEPHHCHRRLVCEYLNSKWSNVLDVRHL
jgi:uncharacterized protein (DUF488 family)